MAGEGVARGTVHHRGHMHTLLGCAVLALLLMGIGRRLSPRLASRLAIWVLVVVTTAFWATQALVMSRVQVVAARQFPGDRTLDIVLSPTPADPLCWDLMLLQRSGVDYVARIGQHSLTGSARPCARSLMAEGAAPLQPMQVPVIEGVRWRAQFTIDAAAPAQCEQPIPWTAPHRDRGL